MIKGFKVLNVCKDLNVLKAMNHESLIINHPMSSFKETIRIEVPFYDIDALNIVWHGNYLKYFEQAREAFGKKFGIGYMDIFNNGYIAPIVEMNIRYMEMARLDDVLLVDITYLPERGAKLVFDYAIRREGDDVMIAKASSTQLFMTRDGQMEYTLPEFYREWREKWGV